jgi:phosphoribosylanthranilate isomerase
MRVIASLPHIKICCIRSSAEAELALAHGADAVGLVGRMPSGPGPIPDRRIAAIARAVGSRAATFLLTSETDASAVTAHVRRTGVSTVQIVDRLTRGSHAELREALPGIALVQVIHVTGEEAVAEAIRVAPHVDALLLDSGNPAAALKELGGTGRVHDWRLSRRIREAVAVPVWLAGGLSSDNVRAAREAVRPYGFDVCSGVRRDGRLDRARLAAFVAAARGTGTEKTDTEDREDRHRRPIQRTGAEDRHRERMTGADSW